MPDNNKENLSPENIRVNKIIEETMKTVSKLDEDIKNYRGALEPHYNPPGIVIENETQKLKFTQNLENLKENLKQIALSQIERTITQLPLKARDEITERARAEFYPPEKSKVLADEKRKEGVTFGEKENLEGKNIFSESRPSLTEIFDQSLLYKRYRNDSELSKQQDRNIDRGMDEKETE